MKLIEYKAGNNKSFFIPEFLSDYRKPEQEPELENGNEESEKAAAWSEHQHEQQLNEFETWK